MATVVIGPLQSKWTLTPDEQEVVVAETTAREKGYYRANSYKFRAWDGMVRFFHPLTQTLPSGLVADCVTALEQRGFSTEVIYDNLKPLLEREDGAIRFTLAEHQLLALEALCTHSRGIIHAATNSGKTKIVEAWCSLYRARVLYLVPSRELLNQTIRSFQNDTNLNIGWLSSSASSGFGYG